MIEQPDVSLSSPIKERIHATRIDSESLRLDNVTLMKQLWDAAEVNETVAEAAIQTRPTNLTEFSHLPASNHDLSHSLPKKTAIIPSFIEPDSFASSHTDSAESKHVSRTKWVYLESHVDWYSSRKHE